VIGRRRGKGDELLVVADFELRLEE